MKRRCNSTCSELPNSAMQVVWPHEQDIFPNLKRRLGLTFCYARPCHLAATAQPLPSCLANDAASKQNSVSQGDGAAAGSATTKAEAEQAQKLQEGKLVRLGLEPALPSAMEPRIHPAGTHFVFLSHKQVRWCTA